jgi:D-glycero-D-manno-heptose 1,7-bisphosphate phosphatase
MPKLVLLERDGVLVEDRPDFVKNPGELVLLPRAAASLRRFNDSGCKVAVVTNQPAVGRGIIDEAMLARIHEHLLDRLAREGARLDLLLHAPEAPWVPGPRCKPGAGMLNEAMRRFGVASYDCVMIGDSLTDLEAAKAADVARILVRCGRGQATQAAGIPRDLMPLRIADDLWQAADFVLGSDTGSEGAS